MASLHDLREPPKKGEYFLSFDDLLEVVRDALVKYKFGFRIPHKDPLLLATDAPIRNTLRVLPHTRIKRIRMRLLWIK
jgi:hypothetical protein